MLGCRIKIFARFHKTYAECLYYSGDDSEFLFLSLALKSLPLGTAYAIWTGIGTVGTVILGIILFKEPVDMTRLIFIGFIVIGIIGLKLVSAH